MLQTCDKVLKLSLLAAQVIFLQDPIGSLLFDGEEKLGSSRFGLLSFLLSLSDSLLVVLLFFFDLGLVLSYSSVSLTFDFFEL